MAELDVTAGAGGVLPGSLGGEQVVDLSVEGLDGGVNLVVLGSQSRLISSVLIVSGKVISATGRSRRSGGTGRTRGTLVHQRKDGFGCDGWIWFLRFTQTVKFNLRYRNNIQKHMFSAFRQRCLQQVRRIQGVHGNQENPQYHGLQLYHPYQGVRGVQQVPEEEIII